MSHLDNGVELHVVVTIEPETINLPLFGFYMDIGLMETIIYHEPIGQYSFRLHRRNTSPCCRIHQTLWWFSWWLAHCCLWVAEVPTLNRFDKCLIWDYICWGFRTSLDNKEPKHTFHSLYRIVPPLSPTPETQMWKPSFSGPKSTPAEWEGKWGLLFLTPGPPL